MAEHPYEMTLSLNVLNHLGLNLYSNIPAVLSETVANAWDADAEKVQITVDDAKGEITITDDGKGMDADAINQRFLTVGYRRRVEDPESGKITKKFNRPVMGRKGIGKLSLFSIAREVRVYSTHVGEKHAFVMLLADIQAKITNKEGAYHPAPIPLDKFPSDLKKGTRIVLTDLKKRTNKAAEMLKVRLARRFSILGKEYKFELTVNGDVVGVKDRGYFNRLQYLWQYGEEGTRIRKLAKKLDFEETRPSEVTVQWSPEKKENFSISGWLGTVKESTSLKDDDGNLNKIVIMVRGKLAQEDILDEFNEGRLFTKYLIGEIHADFLDLDDQEDSATSSRQRLIEDDPRYLALKDFLLKEVKSVANKWTELRDEEGKNKALENPAIKDWFDDLGTDLKKRAKTLFGKINQMPFDSPDDRKRIFGYAVLAFENLRYKDNLDALEKLDGDNIAQLGELFANLDDVEATLYHQILKARIEAIEALEQKVDKNSREKIVQKHLYGHLWLLDPAWERATDTEYMEKTVAATFEKAAAKMSKEERRGRFDIKYKKNSGKHVIIELKKADIRITQGQLSDQGGKYLSALQKILDEQSRPQELMEVIFLIGHLPKGWEDKRARDRGVRALAEQNMRVVLYQELLNGAHRAYKEFIEKRSHTGRLARVLQSLDTSVFNNP